VRLYTDEIPDEPFLLPPSGYRFLGCRDTAFSTEPYGSPDLYQPAAKTAAKPADLPADLPADKAH